MSVALENIEKQPLSQFTEQAYLNYSMYVVLDRALPYIGDGLKPVQRRIIYAMSQLGLSASAKFKKSARTVGDVLGKFHPHGDTACYEAMVLMAQPFSYRYPLVFGQGNWGSMDDPKSFAAMRYTEAKLTPYAEVLLSELAHGTVDWVPNFDGTLQEPARLPARLPNVLLNGSTGIAVGMATDIPPHNLKEVARACVHLLDYPQATLQDILHYIKAPDFPTEAEIITPQKDILEFYQKGVGTLKMRAVYQKDDEDIIISALPYQASGAKILAQIAAQMQNKKIPMVVGLRDESDHDNPTRIVISLRSNRVDSEALMAHLFGTTDLERNYRINLNMIGLDGRPRVKGLLPLLKEWLTYRKETVRRRLQHRLDKVLSRLHILDGLLVAYLNLDEVIRIIRTEDEPKTVLMSRFGLTHEQAEAILETKLRHLAKLEEMKIRGEQLDLEAEKVKLEQYLNSDTRLKNLIKKEIKEDAEKYGDERRSPIVERSEAQAFNEVQTLSSDPMTVVLSEKGWIRAGKGHDLEGEQLSYKAGDKFLSEAKGRMNRSVMVLDSKGRSYSVPIHTLPSARGQGEPLTSRLKLTEGASFQNLLAGEDDDLYLMASSAGYGFVVKYSELYTKNKSGKAVVSVPKGSVLLEPKRVEDMESQYLAAVTSQGRLLLFPIADLPLLSKGKGNKIIHMPPSKSSHEVECLVDLAVLNENNSLILWSGHRKLTFKPNDLAIYQGERGRRGSKLPKGFLRVTRLSVV